MEEGMVTTRNLIDSDIGPLRRFTGILDSIPTEKQTYGQGESAREAIRISLNFKDLDVKESIEPYHFPIYTIQVSQSNRKKSRWGILGDSLNQILDTQYSEEQLNPLSASYVKPSARMDIKDCIGKRLGLVMADGQDGRPASPMLYDGRENVREDRPTPTWTVYEVEGIGVASGGMSAHELAMSLLDGKTLSEFNQAALANPVIRNDATLLQAISLPPTAAKSFVTALIKEGKFTKDGQDTHHKVA